MDHNRIHQLLAEQSSTFQQVPSSSGFAALPTFSSTPGSCGSIDIYRLAYEQAQQQVGRRKERLRQASEWN